MIRTGATRAPRLGSRSSLSPHPSLSLAQTPRLFSSDSSSSTSKGLKPVRRTPQSVMKEFSSSIESKRRSIPNPQQFSESPVINVRSRMDQGSGRSVQSSMKHSPSQLSESTEAVMSGLSAFHFEDATKPRKRGKIRRQKAKQLDDRRIRSTGVKSDLKDKLAMADATQRVERKQQMEQQRISDERMIEAMRQAQHLHGKQQMDVYLKQIAEKRAQLRAAQVQPQTQSSQSENAALNPGSEMNDMDDGVESLSEHHRQVDPVTQLRNELGISSDDLSITELKRLYKKLAKMKSSMHRNRKMESDMRNLQMLTDRQNSRFGPLSTDNRKSSESPRAKKLRKLAEDYLAKKERQQTRERGGMDSDQMFMMHGILNEVDGVKNARMARDGRSVEDMDEEETVEMFDDRQVDIGRVEQFLERRKLPVDFDALSLDLNQVIPEEMEILESVVGPPVSSSSLMNEEHSGEEIFDNISENQDLSSLTQSENIQLSSEDQPSSQMSRAKKHRLAKLAARRKARSKMLKMNEENHNNIIDDNSDPIPHTNDSLTPEQAQFEASLKLSEQTDLNNEELLDPASFDVAMRVWDHSKECWSNEDSLRLQPKKEKLARSERRRLGLRKRWFYVGASPHWLQIPGLDRDVLNELGRVLPTPVRKFTRWPRGCYQFSAMMRDRIQRVLVAEYWPKGWHERKEDMQFAQRLFNAVPNVRWDRRRSLRYIANEYPLSLAVNFQVLSELRNRMPDFQPKAILDFGSGPGCAAMGALQAFNGDSVYNVKQLEKGGMNPLSQLSNIAGKAPIKSVFMIEPNTLMRDYGKTIFSDLHQRYHMAYLPSLNHDQAQQPLVLASFVLSEIPSDKLDETLDELWFASKKCIVIIEAGTPDGFNLVNYARSYLLSKFPCLTDEEKELKYAEEMKEGNKPLEPLPQIGTYTIAPCPHDLQCPLSSEHVCRFIARICRHSVPTRCHFKSNPRRTKQMSSNKKFRMKREADEIQFPFSYCILGKGEVSPRQVYEQLDPMEKTPLFWMDDNEAEMAAYSWPRLITPVKVYKKHLYLNLCLPRTPNYIEYDRHLIEQHNQRKMISDKDGTGEEKKLLLESGQSSSNFKPKNIHETGGVNDADNEKDLRSDGLKRAELKRKDGNRLMNGKEKGLILPYRYGVRNDIRLTPKKYTRRHFNVDHQIEGLNPDDYGYLQRWTVTNPKDRKKQQWQHAKQSHWGDLWPWPSPSLQHFPSLRKYERTRDAFNNWTYNVTPVWESRAQVFQHHCRRFIFSEENKG